MVRFAHLADVHLGGWRQEPLTNLNLLSFEKAISFCLKSKLDFVLISGDLFDSAYPSIEILKEAFFQFKKLSDSKIPCYIIPGSHDYSVSGKTFLDVLEKAGFCKNVYNAEEKQDFIFLNPFIHKNIAIYGYPGKKSGLEVLEIKKIKLNDAPGMFKILMLHTSLDKVIGNLPISFVKYEDLPPADYYALGHIHVFYSNGKLVYPGPIFPNNFQELKDLGSGSFAIVDTSNGSVEQIKLPVKDIQYFEFNVNNALVATEEIISKMKEFDLSEKIILLKVFGELQEGKNSDIKFQKIEEFAKQKGAYFLLRNTHDLKSKTFDFDVEIKDEKSIEKEIIENFSKESKSKFNNLIPELMEILSIEKQEDEKNEVFNQRLLAEAKKVLEL